MKEISGSRDADSGGVVSTRLTSKLLPRLALEGLTIVVGILMAFGIDAWWDDRSAAAAERALLGDVVEELGDILRVLELAGAAHEIHRESAQRLIADGSELPEDELAEAVTGLLGFVTLDISTGALDAAVSTDGLGRIAGDSTRILLARWPGAYADLAENEELEVELIEHFLHPMLRSRVLLPDLAAYARRTGPRESLNGMELPPVRDSLQVRRDLRAMAADRELQGLYFQLLSNDTESLSEYLELRALAQAIISSIEESIRP